MKIIQRRLTAHHKILDGMQACLDKLIKAQQDQGQVSLSLDAVNAFVKKFETQCVMSKE